MVTFKKVRRGTLVKTLEHDPGIDDVMGDGIRLAYSFRKPHAAVTIVAEISESEEAEILELLEARDRAMVNAPADSGIDFMTRTVLNPIKAAAKLKARNTQ
jgi:hypothetical protein